ncbi:hypothetical protein [Comamonas sp. UBA7528]|uniref:hypothetical protein n=1 Tax=Comamonas sp. UBA7528 TaxID=1946391 RepID=UPI0025BF5CCC|nr:hypothetical protein [Comamonas sp. UBA7528]
MNLRQIADLTVARLGMPIPMAKLVTMQAIAQELARRETGKVFAESLADWASSRELESQCLEALCPLLVALPKQETVALIRKAISRPSVASDALLSIATGSPTIIASWTGCHSGPASRHDDLHEELTELCEGTFISPIYGNRFERLQARTDLPFLSQWGFEYRQLLSRFGRKGDGYIRYFCGSDRETGGYFVARQGHLARSAFLRTLAFAVDHWDMPISAAISCAELAYPAEAIFLRFPPQPAPTWASKVQSRAAAEAQDASTVAKTLIDTIEVEVSGRLIHCSFTVVDEPKVRVDFEAFAVSQVSENLDVDEVFEFHQGLLGEFSPDRDALRAFVSPEWSFQGDMDLGFAPLVLPLLGHHIGYLQADLLGRAPYVPVSSPGLPNLELVPTDGCATFRSDGRNVGSWVWWCWHWRPTHVREQPPSIACCTTLTYEASRALVNHLGGKIGHIWRITRWTRDNDYGKWAESKTTGWHPR